MTGPTTARQTREEGEAATGHACTFFIFPRLFSDERSVNAAVNLPV